ncbi:MAG: ABC transporter permease [Desulfobacterales bacterium]|nr:ABC transporter permease [Desulfobacterales bacterium]
MLRVRNIYGILFQRGNLFGLILPLFIYLLFFYAYPALQMMARSFFAPTFTLEFYNNFLNVAAFKIVMFNTFSIAFFATLFCLALGYPIAYLLTMVSQKVSQILILLIVIPFWISILVRSYAWMILLGKNGIINQLLIKLGIIQSALPLLHNRFGLYVGMINILLPFMVLPLFSVMQGIEKNLVKSAQILGAPPWKAFLKVFFPLSLPGVAGGGLLVFIIALGFFITPALLGGPKDTMIAQLIQIQMVDLVNWNFASALATILLFIALIVFAIYNRFLGIDKLVGK